MINKILALMLILTIPAYADVVNLPTTYANGSTVTASNLNANPVAIAAVINGGLDNNNANTTSGYRFYETKAALPSAGTQGRTVFLTSDNSLNLDTGSAWVKTITPSGVLATGQIPYYNSGWSVLSPGAQYYSLVSNGVSSLPSYQQVNLTQGVTSTLPIANGGTNITTYTQGDILYSSASNTLSKLPAGTSGQFLKTQGAAANPIWATAQSFSNTIFSYSSSCDNTGFITGTTLTGTASSNYNYWAVIGAQNSVYKTVISGKWIKIAGVNTVTVWVRIWSGTALTTTAKVDIGGANSTVNGSAVTSPEWKSMTIDVSGLTNGNSYDVTIQIAHTDAGGGNDYLCGAVGLGS